MGKLSSEEVNMLLEMKVFSYSFLKHIFYVEPSKEFLKIIVEENIVEAFPFADEHKLIEEGIREVNNFLKINNILEKKEYEKIHWDYTRMFIGPNALPVPPWESVYLNEDRLVFQEETFQVRKNYLKYCFIPRNYPHEPDDHIGTELDFMYRLNEMAMENNEAKHRDKLIGILKDQENFLKEHLVKWIPEFSNHMVNNANTEFYRGIAKVLKGYIEFDYVSVKELIHSLS